MSDVILSERQMAALALFRGSPSPITLKAAFSVEGGQPGTVMVQDGSGRVFFLLADGTSTSA